MIIVDESISDGQLAKVLIYLNLYDKNEYEIVQIKDTYPGIPDEEILKHILNEKSIFVIADCVIHNKVLANNKRSIYIDQTGQISKKILKGIIIAV